MDRVKLSCLNEELDSSEVAALCFLCRNIISKRQLEEVHYAKDLFLRLEEKGLMGDVFFLSQLLRTINRADLLSQLETDSKGLEESNAAHRLSAYTVMLYEIHQDLNQYNFDKMKFLLDSHPSGKLEKRKLELCKTPLDLFAEMERTGLLSNRKLDVLHETLQEFDRQLATTVERYMQGLTEPEVPPHVSMDHQRINNNPPLVQPSLPVTESQPSHGGEIVYTDSDPVTESPSLYDPADYYDLSHNPRGLCVIFNNEEFQMGMGRRRGSKMDEEALCQLFSRFGFTVVVHSNLTADAMRQEVQYLSKRDFSEDDGLVVCVLSHGEQGVVFGTDELQVEIQDLTQPFTSRNVPTLIGKPKLFFIQANQGNSFQEGAVQIPPTPKQMDRYTASMLVCLGGPSRVREETVPWDADFLLGMATVPKCKTFRHTVNGSIYIQELCRQLQRSAESPEMDDILSVLTRVNREVSKGVFLNYKQMPEPKYTLTRKLVLKYV
ncbi:caspase-8-like [Cheilinus undulatus]|uniref:caspase-8-like n=1 Tax=Cheilinus undulatus TaxID=241271 RepID=UPI001BD2B16A|nr:caspase-8-like [Cheilinus undulatus]